PQAPCSAVRSPRRVPVRKEDNMGVDSQLPRLSVAICTRNRADKLKRAVASILANTFDDFELIVIDQSTDGKTAAALSAIDDPRVRYIPTDTVGLAKSRNVAVRESRADILVYTDDDCVCDRG